MRKRKQELVICSNINCNKSFMKDSSEVKRNNKINRKNYCSLVCSGHMNSEHLKKYTKENGKYLLPHCDNRKDKYTGLREHLRRVKKRKHLYDITVEDLFEQWETQSGMCVYSGVKLIHPGQNGNNINTASLDRINSNLGYVKGNIQFISIMCNFAKNSTTHEDMLKFTEIIHNFLKSK